MKLSFVSFAAALFFATFSRRRLPALLVCLASAVVPSHQRLLPSTKDNAGLEEIDDIPILNHSTPSLRTRSLQPFLPVANDPWNFGGAVVKAVGRLTASNQAGMCTATVIKESVSDRFLLITAAHCLCNYVGKFWYKDFLFMPMRDFPGATAYNPAVHGAKAGDARKHLLTECPKSPFGCWKGTVPLVEVRYVDSTWPSATTFDYGMLVIPADAASHIPGKGPGGNNPCLQCVVGGGMEVDTSLFASAEPVPPGAPDPNPVPAFPMHYFVGHPASHDPDLRYCLDFLSRDTLFPPRWTVAACTMTGGASGSPMLPADGGLTGNSKIRSVKSSGLGCSGPVLYDYFAKCVLPVSKTVPLAAMPGRIVFDPACKLKEKVKAKVVKDPHFETWSGEQFDFMGGCDLVLLQAPHFAPDLTLEIIVRTKVRYFYSYVQTAIIKIGEDLLEVSGFGEYSIDGVSSAALPNAIAGFEVTHSQPSANVSTFEIHLTERESIVVGTYKEMVSIKLDDADGWRFHDSRGMFGDYETGKMLARDGITVLDDPNAFGAEWQVRDDEPMLFQTAEFPQYPQKCVFPLPVTSEGRRLAGEGISREDAEIACAKWSDDTREGCIHDVRATGDLELAAAGAF